MSCVTRRDTAPMLRDSVTKCSVTQCSVTESVTQSDLAKCPPLSSHPSPAFLTQSSLSQNMQLCNTLRKLFINCVGVLCRMLRFQGSEFLGFPWEAFSPPTPPLCHLLGECGTRRHGMSQCRRYSQLTLYTSHRHKMFPSLVFCSSHPPRPVLHAHAVTSKHCSSLLHRRCQFWTPFACWIIFKICTCKAISCRLDINVLQERSAIHDETQLRHGDTEPGQCQGRLLCSEQ